MTSSLLSSSLPSHVGGWLLAFLFTQAIEVPIYQRTLGCGADVAFGASALTHPIVWFVFPWLGRQLPGGSWPEVTVAAELFAWLVEAAYFAVLCPGRRVAVWSLLANAASFTAGQIAFGLLGAG